MVTIVHEASEIHVPDWVNDLESFRRWKDSGDLPEHLRTCYLQGEVWIDVSKEQLFTHNLVKTEITIVLGSLIREKKLGLFFSDGLLLSNETADISVNPDGTCVSYATLQNNLARLIEGVEEGHVELEGSPDLVIEVVSRSSVQKDTVQLREGYRKAEIPEYWLIDARGEPLQFDILRRTKRGYSTTRKQDGWVKSAVLDCSFQLIRETDPLGNPQFTLQQR